MLSFHNARSRASKSSPSKQMLRARDAIRLWRVSCLVFSRLATTTTGDGRDDGQLVGFGDGGFFVGGKVAKVFIVEIDVHERAQLALGAEEVRPHRRMLLDKLLQALGDRRACHRDSFLLFGEGSQRCGD